MKTENLLFEIGVEEMPAAFIPVALADIEKFAEEGLKGAGLSYKGLKAMGTPRRLALFVSELISCQPDREEDITGPPAKIALAPDGALTKAGEGFLRAQGAGPEAVRIKDTGKGPCLVLHKVIKGRETRDVLASFLPLLAAKIRFPRTMKWGASSFRFARPIRWVVALFGDEVIPFEIAGIESGKMSMGHRFMAPGPFEVRADLASYIEALRRRFVIVDMGERRDMLLKGVMQAVAGSGGSILQDDDLIELNTNLTEYPSAVCGSFDGRFLGLPREVLITVMKEHQKYFAVVDGDGALRPNFVAINNIRPADDSIIRKGHERVLRARLADAAFFFEEDMKIPLHERVDALSGIVFNQYLGTMLDKTERVKSLALYLARGIAPEKVALVERAAYLSKADLLTGMVGEFPDLQGVMGREYALRSGECDEVATAIHEHYMPIRAGGTLPSSMTGSILSIADKIDTICGMFLIGLQPSGTQDPFGLRRQALGVLHILEASDIRFSLAGLIDQGIKGVLRDIKGKARSMQEAAGGILEFFRGRMVNNMTSRGYDLGIVEAAIRVGFDDVVDCVRRIKALAAVRVRPEFEPLSIAFKRVMNILKGFEGGDVDQTLFEAPEEKALFDAYMSLKDDVLALLRDGSYEDALIRLLSLKPLIDNFFDHVMVMVEEPRIRTNRLSILWQISNLFLRVGDLSAVAM
ncbi:glycine--tRNA ligase subunit beta [Dissulfurimicrobium hydrothermale]|uniref:glycine--tRNA ligase subunit beta n=1 Tax=Dissulfurimicrobium hydrothermale TaxID=1750598 RepID=UPI001EDA8EAA|nr:glycine--tRNA ligase subunit beta [Dissulfurimicrobium hydrothermale]UKL13803.1 glycine--tRNA ligase subunit beta [Dissulfurimicrobium hydrothermale]